MIKDEIDPKTMQILKMIKDNYHWKILLGSVLDIAPAVEGSVTITAPFKRSIKRHILFKVWGCDIVFYDDGGGDVNGC